MEVIFATVVLYTMILYAHRASDQNSPHSLYIINKSKFSRTSGAPIFSLTNKLSSLRPAFDGQIQIRVL